MKQNLKFFTALAMFSLAASACGGEEDADTAKNDGVSLAIMSQAEACTSGDFAICACPEGNKSYQMCLDGVWSDCACDVNLTPEEIEEIDSDSVQNIFGGIFFSEYVEGSSNNKAIEVSNASAKAANCEIRLYSNGSSTPTASVSFSIESSAVGAFCNSSAQNALKGRCFATSAIATFNGDDALDLFCDGKVVDVFGHIGTRPKNKWSQDGFSTADMTLRRKPTILVGRTETDPEFTSLSTDWIAFAKDTFDDIGAHSIDLPSDISQLDIPESTDAGTDPVDIGTDAGSEEAADAGIPELQPDASVDPIVDPPEPEPEPEVELPEWTLMVYMNGDNNLYQYAASDFKEMQKLTNDKDINVIVLYDDYGNNNTNLYRVKPGGKVLLDSGSEIYSGKEADMGDYQTLKKFGIWAVTNYPAKRYAMVLWNHGGGWRNDDGSSSLFRDFSNDEYGNYNGIYISNGNYANALAAIVKKAGQKFDIVGFDACLMAMYEVATATSPYAKYLIGSEETEPANGWSYDYFLPLLSKKPSMDALTLAKHVTDGYYSSSDENATSSVTDLSTMDELNTSLDAFASELKKANAKTKFKNIRSGLLEFAVAEHVDLRQFVQAVAADSSLSSSVRDAANALDEQLEKTVAYERAHNFYDSYYRQYFYYDKYTHGLAIYFPERKNTSEWNNYKNGVWYNKTSWGSFVSSIW